MSDHEELKNLAPYYLELVHYRVGKQLRYAKQQENHPHKTIYLELLNDELVLAQKQEIELYNRLIVLVKQHLMFSYLSNIKGCGMAAMIALLGLLDINKAKYPSSFWSYAGYDPTSTTGDRRLKSAMFVMIEGMIKLGDNYYEKVYRDYKNRIIAKNNLADDKSKKTDGHLNMMAMRYTSKIFLLHLHIKWREIAGLEVSVPYHEAKLGIKHSSPNPTFSEPEGKVKKAIAKKDLVTMLKKLEKTRQKLALAAANKANNLKIGQDLADLESQLNEISKELDE